MKKLFQIIIGLLVVQVLSGCVLGTIVDALASARKIPVDERTLECEDGVATHHEELDNRRKRHIIDFVCFPPATDPARVIDSYKPRGNTDEEIQSK